MAFPGQLSDLTEENLANISLPGHPHTNPAPFVHEGVTQPLPQSPSRRSHHSSTPSVHSLGSNQTVTAELPLEDIVFPRCSASCRSGCALATRFGCVCVWRSVGVCGGV